MKPLYIIVCCARNAVIGKDNKLPWRLPEDMKRFKELTTGHPIIMGRKTYESIGRPLPNRLNIVVSNTMGLLGPPEVHVSLSLQLALGVAEFGRPGVVPFVIGGAQLYEAAIPLATRIYMSTYQAEIEGDKVFPSLIADHWQIDHHEQLRNDLTFTELNRRPSSLLDL